MKFCYNKNEITHTIIDLIKPNAIKRKKKTVLLKKIFKR